MLKRKTEQNVVFFFTTLVCDKSSLNASS